MKVEMRLVRKTDKRVVYQLDDISRITNEFLEQISWPNNIPGMIILFDKKIENEHLHLSGISSKYFVSIGYSAQKGQLLNNKISLPKRVKPKIFNNFNELKQVYYDTKLMFYKIWEEYLGDRFLIELDFVAKNYLPTAKVLYLEKNEKPAALITVIKWKDYADIPVDWINWVWVAPTMPKKERLAIRCYFSEWLRINIKDRVQCVVNSFNVSSQKFFRKLGFIPECIHVIKAK